MELIFLAIGLLLPFLFFRPKDFFQPEFFINFLFVVLIGLGPFSLYFFIPAVYQGKPYDEVSLVILLGYISLNLGFLFARFFYPRKILLTNLSGNFSEWLVRRSRGMYVLGIILSFFAILGGFLFFYRAGFIPLLASNKDEARVAAMSVSGNGYFLYLLALGVVAPSFMALFYLKDKVPIKLFSPPFIFLVLAISVLLLFTGSRRYVIWLLIYLLAVYHYAYKIIPMSKMLTASMLGLLFIVLFEIFRNPDSDTTAGFLIASVYRFIIYTSNLEKVYSYFQHADIMLGGTFFMDVLTVLPGKQVDYQSWLKELVGLEFEGFGIPPTIMGDFYINFGLWGVFFGVFTLGFILRSLYGFLILKGRSGLGLLFYISVLEIGSKTITSGISAQSIGFLWLAIFYSCAWFAMQAITIKARV